MARRKPSISDYWWVLSFSGFGVRSSDLVYRSRSKRYIFSRYGYIEARFILKLGRYRVFNKRYYARNKCNLLSAPAPLGFWYRFGDILRLLRIRRMKVCIVIDLNPR